MATVTIGYNAQAVTAGLQKTQQQIAQTSAQINASTMAQVRARANEMNKAEAWIERGLAQNMGGGGGGKQAKSIHKLGGVSMQLQDVAVQLQSGTAAATVLAQQGSQVASVFGPGGAIIGGIIAVGAGLYTVGQKGKEAFDGVISESDKLHLSFAKIAKSGSLPDLSNWAQSSITNLGELGKQMEATHSTWGKFTALLAGESWKKRETDIASKRGQTDKDLAKANQLAVDLSARDLSLSEAKASGDKERIITKEAELELAKKIEAIKSTSFFGATKAQMISDAQSAVGGETKKKLDDLANEKKRAVDSVAGKLAVTEAKASGKDNVAKALEREISLRERTLELADQLNVSATAARAIAEREADAQDKINSKKDEKKGHIKGFSRARGDEVHEMVGIGKAKFSGLRSYDRLQGGGWNERYNAAFGSGPSLDVLTNPKRLAMYNAREKAMGKTRDKDKGDAAQKANDILAEIARSVQALRVVN